MLYIHHGTGNIYTGDRIHHRDIPANPEHPYPGPDYVPLIEDGEHVGWEVDEAKRQQRLAEWRETATLSPSDFFIAAKRLGILTPEEALAAAKGEAPDLFVQIVSSDESIDSIEAQILFARMSRVERLHPFVLGVTAALELDEATIDDAFGWEG